MPAPSPLVLRADNWTPPERTPWGGRAIAERWKAGLPLPADKAAWPAIGESWELSFDPAFPSRDAAGDTLAAHIARDPEGWLGPDPVVATRARSLLVKLLDAADALSVQVHPNDDDPALGPGESGKPEAWVVLARAPGAGLWLGLADDVSADDLSAAIDTGDTERVARALNFVPVEVGDAFVIDAGTVHAIGPGITLLEPQLVHPGRTGVTYRFWDWGRRFDAAGRPDPNGRARALHRDRSFAVTAWDAPRGAAFVARCRRTPRRLDAHREHLLDIGRARLERHVGSGEAPLEGAGLRAIFVAAGRVSVEGVIATRGQTLVVPAACRAPIALDHAEAFVIAA